MGFLSLTQYKEYNFIITLLSFTLYAKMPLRAKLFVIWTTEEFHPEKTLKSLVET